jgi:PAS domain S-box-containing protein
VIGVVLVFRDVTEEYRMRRDLREREEKFRSLVEGSPNCVKLFDRAGRYVAINHSGLEAMGWTEEDVLGRRFPDVWPEETQPVVEEALAKALQGEKSSFEAECMRPDGTPVTWWVVLNPILNEDRAVTQLVGISIDVTERKQAENALRESKERFDQLAEQSRTITWEVDANGLYTYVSRTAASVLGYKPEDLVGRMHFYDLHPDAERDAFKSAALEVFARKESFRDLENQAETKMGQRIWVSTNGMPVLDEDGNLLGYRGNDTDITERKRTEPDSALSTIPIATASCSWTTRLFRLQPAHAVALRCEIH